ncbi:MAG: LAGLIDADG family homing endonuclease, partial [Anaerolineae bacterium]
MFVARTLEEVLDSQTREGALYEKLDDDKLRCYACGHRCVIFEGQRGICKVRYNDAGQLRVPWGYVASLQSDPTEKKPFFHVLPGSDTLTFGMLGCDYHCSYCFTGDTPVVTDQGVLPIEEIYRQGQQVEQQSRGDVAVVEGLQAVVGSGELRRIVKAFRHEYSGPLVVVDPYYLPPIRCTPDHRIYATTRADELDVKPVPAGELTMDHYLVIPRQHHFASSQEIDAYQLLLPHQRVHQVPHVLSDDEVAGIMVASKDGVTSREIGRRLGKRADYIRHVRSKVRRGLWLTERIVEVQDEDGYVRFPKEHRPGIPRYIPLNEDVAYLLGLYCADGCVSKAANRPGSYTLMFSFNPTEKQQIAYTRRVLRSIFGYRPKVVHRDTTTALDIGRGSVALLFSSLCGASAQEKRVPVLLFQSPRAIIEAFLDAYVQGDGHRYDSGKVSITTVSPRLAYGVAWLALKLGYLPSVYAYQRPETGEIQGRKVQQAPEQFTVVWYQDSDVPRRYVTTDDYYLIPLRSVSTESYEGEVYNLEVEEEHNYLASFFLVKNCQNWLTSQTLRDPEAGL